MFEKPSQNIYTWAMRVWFSLYGPKVNFLSWNWLFPLKERYIKSTHMHKSPNIFYHRVQVLDMTLLLWISNQSRLEQATLNLGQVIRNWDPAGKKNSCVSTMLELIRAFWNTRVQCDRKRMDACFKGIKSGILFGQSSWKLIWKYLYHVSIYI